jgi:hypothetical protein
MTAENLAGKCEIDYIYMEMVLNKDTKYDVITGLFKGIVEKKGQKFVLLQGLSNTTNVLSTKFYNIMTIEVREGDYKNYTYLTCEKVDQDIGYEKIEKLAKTLLDNGFGVANDPEIIDTDKYKEVPKDYVEGKPLGNGTAQSGTASGVGSFASPHSRYSQGAHTYTKQTTVKPDPVPGLIARTKTKKPSKTALEEMLEKVRQVTADTFEPELPEIMGEDDTGVTEADDDDYAAGYYNGFCG